MTSIGLSLLDRYATRIGVTGVARRCGLSAGSVSNHLSGRRTPNRAAREAYRVGLGIDPEAFDREW